jgi:hypothetical protein
MTSRMKPPSFIASNARLTARKKSRPNALSWRASICAGCSNTLPHGILFGHHMMNSASKQSVRRSNWLKL